jgi:tubulin-specific chaperone D
MDAPEEDLDIKLQKISGDLLGAFDNALVPFLRKSDGHGGTEPRSRVRSRDLHGLIARVCQ